MLKDIDVAAEIIVTALLAGLFEEFIFRKTIQEALLKRSKNKTGKERPIRAIVISAIIFGLVHLMNLIGGAQDLPTTISQVIMATGAGFFFGALFYKTGSIKIPILIHFIYDIAAGITQLGLTLTPNDIAYYLGDISMLIINILLFIDLMKDVLFKKKTIKKLDKFKPLAYIIILVGIILVAFIH
jgi:membrane protease YdiL (CAAX protease family)